MTVYDPPANSVRCISVRGLLEDPALDLQVRLVAGDDGLDREIRHPRIQKSGLSLVGHRHGVVPDRIQVLGETELSYVLSLDEPGARRAAEHLFGLELSCVFITCGGEPPASFVAEATRTETPLVICQERSSSAITALHTLLDERLAPRTRMHGVLVDVFEVGVLLLGDSGIGKSESALELVMRGHRLVADDVIEFDYRPPGIVFGQAAVLLRHHIEVRGLGILNIKDLYGVTAIRDRKRVDLIVYLEKWREDREYDRIGVTDLHREILGVPIREVRIPVMPGRNMSSIIEVAARTELLRQAGHNSAQQFVERIEAHTLGLPVLGGREPSLVSLVPESALRPPSNPDYDGQVPPPPRRGGRP